MKRFWIVVRSVIMAAAIVITGMSLTGCASKSGSTLYVLTYKPEYNEFFKYVNDLYLKENTDIKKIEYSAVDTNDYNTVLNSRIQSKALDVFASQVSYMMQGQATYMLPLEHKDYFDKMDPQFLALGQYYDPAVGGDVQQLTMPLEFNADVVFYNRDIFDEYGKEVPKTWDEFLSLCKFFGDVSNAPVSGKTKIEAPLVFGGKSEWPAMNILNAIVPDTVELQQPDFFNQISQYNSNSAIRFNTPIWVESFQKLSNIAQYIPNDLYGLDYSYAPTYFSTGVPSTGKMYPMMIDGTWSLSQIKGSFKVGAFVLPASNKTANSEGKINLATKAGLTVSVYKNSSKAKAAQKYLDLLFSQDVYQKFLKYSSTPSVMTNVPTGNDLISSIFDSSRYTYTEMYDSRMPRYMPLPSGSDLISVMKNTNTPQKVADTLQAQVDANKADWQKYTDIRHKK